MQSLAWPARRPTAEMARWSPVPFDKVITNPLLAFDEVNSQFICEEPGVYYFTFSAGLESNMGAHLVLEKDLPPGCRGSEYGHRKPRRGILVSRDPSACAARCEPAHERPTGRNKESAGRHLCLPNKLGGLPVPGLDIRAHRLLRGQHSQPDRLSRSNQIRHRAPEHRLADQ